MGLFSNFSLSNIYNKAKGVVSNIYSGAKKVTGIIKKGFDFVDELANKASSIPYIGSTLKQGYDKLTNTPVLGVSYNDLKAGVNRANEFLNSGKVEEVSRAVDKVAAPVTEAIDRARGVKVGA